MAVAQSVAWHERIFFSTPRLACKENSPSVSPLAGLVGLESFSRIGRVVTTDSGGTTSVFLAVTFRVKLSPGEGGASRLALPHSVFGLSLSGRAADDRTKGEVARPSRMGPGRTNSPSPTTEKMLSAISELSNIFLQTGQNIEIADKNAPGRPHNFGSRRGLAFY